MSEKTSVLRTAVWERSRNGESVSEIARALNTDERIVTLIVNTFERLESKRRSGERPLPDMKDALRAVQSGNDPKLFRSEKLRIFRSYLIALLGTKRGLVRILNGVTDSQARSACLAAERSGVRRQETLPDDVYRAMLESAFAAFYRRIAGDDVFDEENVPHVLEAWGKTIEAFSGNAFSAFHPHLDDASLFFETALRIREGVKRYRLCPFCRTVHLTDAEEKVLSDIRLEIKKGQTVGIIGGTGAGKSAMINLMLRLYDADSGHVRVFGHDVRDFTFRALRSTVHIVSQGSRLFKGTVLDNLTCGKTDVPDEQIEAALRISQSAEFAEKLPDRLQTPVEEGGKNFSGGQRQRLCIARALVGDPEIIIFDDSSSALDYATDAKMRRAIATELSGKTIVLVSQRVSTVRNADQIVLMDDGKICGIGTHEQLFRDNELYREICHSQLSEKEAANA